VFAAAALSESVTHELLRLDSVATQVAAAARSSTDALRSAMDSITLHGVRFPFISSPVAMAMANEWQMRGITDDTASLLDRLQSFLDEAEAREEEVIKLTTEVRKLSKEQRGLSAKDIINYIFTLFIFFYQENSSKETEQRLTTKIEATQTSVATVQRDVARIESLLLQILQQLPAKPAAEVYFVVRDRPAIVRTKPASGAAQTGKIMPNQQATLVGEDRQWIEIEYFDLRDQVQNRGWVLKKYLKRQPARH
jgi:hypothetical protein